MGAVMGGAWQHPWLRLQLIIGELCGTRRTGTRGRWAR